MSYDAIFVATKVCGWGGTKSRKDLENALLTSENMSRDAAKLILNLVTPEFQSKLKSFDSGLNAVKAKWTLPTGATSIYVLPLAAKDSFEAAWQEAQDFRKKGVREILESSYVEQIELAKDRLGQAFRESDYPTVDEIVDRFEVKTVYMPFPDSDHVTESDLKEAVEAARREATQTAHEAAWNRLYGTCRDFVARLHNYHQKTKDGQKTKYHATIVENLQGLVESLELMNMFDDPKLTESLNILKTMIGGVAPETLKADEYARLEAIRVAQSVIDGAFPVPQKAVETPVVETVETVEEDSPVVVEEKKTAEWSVNDLF